MPRRVSFEAEKERQARDAEDARLDAADCAAHVALPERDVCARCGLQHPTIITAIWSFYHADCYAAVRRELEGRPATRREVERHRAPGARR
jgi:hypothetical protein